MISVDVKDLSPQETYFYLIAGIAPRPIALVSTVNKEGKSNLAPFSFFNAFGANPPMIGFSPARRSTDGSQKDTYNNIMETKECVVQVVNYDLVEKISLSSTEYAPGIDEFIKSGMTAIDSDIVKAKRVKESPFQMECKLHQMVHLGDKGGAGNLAICEVLKFHISEDVMKDGRINPYLIDLVGRNAGSFYTRANDEALFEIKKPIGKQCMGYDQLPDYLLNSEILTGKNLAMLAHAETVPEALSLDQFRKELKEKKYELNGDLSRETLEKTIQEALRANDLDFAWKAAVMIKSVSN